MRLLALDLGDRRIGLAVGDSSLGTAFPAGRLQRTKLRADLQLVREAARQREAEGFVVGVPYLPSGEVGHQARMAQGFIQALKQALKKDVPTAGLRSGRGFHQPRSGGVVAGSRPRTLEEQGRDRRGGRGPDTAQVLGESRRMEV